MTDNPVVTIDGVVCSDVEVATIQEALAIFAGIGQGQLADVGSQVYNEYLGRRDITAEFRQRITKVRDLFIEAHKTLHGSDNLTARFNPNKDAMPMSSIRAYLILCKLNRDQKGAMGAYNMLRIQAEMAVPQPE